MKSILSCVLVLGLSAALLTAQSPSAADLYQEALRIQQVKGDLGKAVELFRAITTRFPTDRTVTPKAMLKLGECYELLSRPDAIATYQRAVTTFPDQPEIVAAAKTRLAALAPTPAKTPATAASAGGLSTRRLLTTDGAIGDITPDGRLVVGYSSPRPDADLVIRDMATGQVRILDPTVGAGSTMKLSPDGRQVAYQVRRARGGPGPDYSGELRLIGTDPGEKPRTLVGTDATRGIWPVAWSPDGRSILVDLMNAQGEFEIAWVSSSDGGVRRVKTLEAWRRPLGGVALSPDGNFVAYSAAARAGSQDRHIYVMDANGENETDAVKIAGMNINPFWTSDGGHLLFAGNSSGIFGRWSVPMHAGRAVGEPTPLQKGFQNSPIAVSPIAASPSGDLYVTRSLGDGSGNRLEVIASRTPGGAKVQQVFGGWGGTLSRDGGSLAFLKFMPERAVIVRSLTTGEERTYAHAELADVSPRWLPDGSGFVVGVNAEGGRPVSFYLVDVKTGAFKWLFAKDTDTTFRSRIAALSPDGKRLYLMARRKDAADQGFWTSIVGVDLGTGEEREVASLPERTIPMSGGTTTTPDGFALAVSPDGKTLAVEYWADAEAAGASANGALDWTKGRAKIATVRVDGTGYRELYGPYTSFFVADSLRWAPDGQSVVFLVNSDAIFNNRVRAMRVSLAGGPPAFDGMDLRALVDAGSIPRVASGPWNLDLSADGTRMVFGVMAAAQFELSIIENFTAVLNDR